MQGFNTVYGYDIADRLTGLANNVNSGEGVDFDYADYDNVGNRKSCEIDDTPGQVYDYDELYQLTSVDYKDARGLTSYSYDALGNRTQVNKNGTVTNYTSNSLNQYTSVGGVTYSYDDNGNLTSDGFYKYFYDCENRLTDVNYVSNDQRVASYEYDYLGRRVSKTNYTLNPVRCTLYCYDGAQVIVEYEDGSLARKFVYGVGIDEPVAMYSVEHSEWYYYHFDGLGSVVALSDSTGTIVEQCKYDVFGEPDCISDVGNPYKFTGRRYDPETGLYYYRARYYKPEIGRFMSPDPAGYKEGVNLYTYCRNNPVNYRDPYGEYIVPFPIPMPPYTIPIPLPNPPAPSPPKPKVPQPVTPPDTSTPLDPITGPAGYGVPGAGSVGLGEVVLQTGVLLYNAELQSQNANKIIEDDPYLETIGDLYPGLPGHGKKQNCPK